MTRDDAEERLERENARLREALRTIGGHLGAALVQRAPSDDAIIFEHIEAAHTLAVAGGRP
jgi:biotin synthase-related radical SAM superfamily protein